MSKITAKSFCIRLVGKCLEDYEDLRKRGVSGVSILEKGIAASLGSDRMVEEIKVNPKWSSGQWYDCGCKKVGNHALCEAHWSE